MPANESPLTHAIGLSGVMRWLIAVALVLAVGAAAADGQYTMASVVAVFAVTASVLAYRVRHRGSAPPKAENHHSAS